MRNVKIVCTLGPASASRETIGHLAAAGMSVARLNASHGTPAERAELIEHIRRVETDERRIGIMLDLQGPEIRTAEPETNVELVDGDVIRFVHGDAVTTDEIGLSHDVSSATPGTRILLDDGRIEATVTGVDGSTVIARIEDGGVLDGRKSVNVPGVDVGFGPVTTADRRELELAADHDVDFVAASFVRDAADVYAVNEALEALDVDVPVIAKIERADAVEHVEEIVDAAYGVMVARGDLGVECPMEQVPVIQKRIIRRCRDAGVPVITATEMLDSMVHERRPTRAEASDVANAVLDGTDAVMLSAETAVGDDPVRTVEAMDRIVREVEGSPEYDEHREQWVPASGASRTDALARSARFLARDLDATAVVAATESGYTALKTAKFRPPVPVVAATPNDSVGRRLTLSWGVIPRRASLLNASADAVIRTAVGTALDAGVAESGDTVVVLSGMMTELEGANTTNLLKVHVAAETIATGRVVCRGRVEGPVYRSSDGDVTDAPTGAILVLPGGFDGDFEGDLDRVAGIVAAKPGMTGYAALVSRELGIPMVSDASIPPMVRDGDMVTLDAERGVVYEGEIGRAERT